jgi:hypothetical protein
VGLDGENDLGDFTAGNIPGGGLGSHNYNEEEKIPNISKTRINDASAIQYTNSNYD